MRNAKLLAGVVVTVAVSLLAFEFGTATAQKTKGKTRAASTKQLMKGFVSVNCGGLGKALKAEEVNWDDVALKAALLNEASYVLMDDGRCPDGHWANAAKSIRAQSVAILAAAEAKNLDNANTAFKALTSQGCAACHKVHKGK